MVSSGAASERLRVAVFVGVVLRGGLVSAPSVGLARRDALLDVKSAAQSLEVTSGGQGSAYFASLDLGGAAVARRTVHVQLDTGSSTLAIPSQGLSSSASGIGCHSGQCASGAACGATCDSGQGALAIGQCHAREFCSELDPGMCQDCCTVDGLCFFSMRYGDGSGIAGGLHRDWISVGDGSLGVQYTFGSITAQEGNFEPEELDGILGIGYAALNCNPTCHPSFIDSLVTSNELPDLFALCLAGLDGRYSTFEIGEVVDSKYTGTMHWLPVLEATYYVVPRPGALYVGETEVVGCSPPWVDVTADHSCDDADWGQVIVDSGSTEIVLNAPLYAATLDLLETLSPLTEGRTCMEFPDDYDPTLFFPTLRFHFTDEDGAPFDLTLSAAEYMLKHRDQDTPLGRTRFCVGIASGGAGRTILGDVLMQAYYSVFDRRPTPSSSAGRVGFAPVTECHESHPPLWRAPPSGVVGQGGLLEFLAADSDTGVRPVTSGQASSGDLAIHPGGGAVTQSDFDQGQHCVSISGVHYCDADDIIAGMRAHPERVGGTGQQHDAVLPTLEQAHLAACNGSSPPLMQSNWGQLSQLNFFSDLHYGDNDRCVWQLTCAEPGMPVTARVTQLDIEAQFDTLRFIGASGSSSRSRMMSQAGITAAVRSTSDSYPGLDVELSGHSFDSTARVHESMVLTSASADAGLLVQFSSDGLRTGRGFVLEYGCGVFDRCGVPNGDGTSCSVEVDSGWHEMDVLAFAAPLPVFFEADSDVEYLITARVLNGVSALNASITLYEWSAISAQAGAQLAIARDGCDGDPQLLWNSDGDPQNDGISAPRTLLIELAGEFIASSGSVAFRVDTHTAEIGCTPERACHGCPKIQRPSAETRVRQPSLLLVVAAVAVVGACCAAVATATVRRGWRSNAAQDDDIEASEKLGLLKAEDPEDCAAGKAATESESASGRQEQSAPPALSTVTDVPGQEELGVDAGLGAGKPQVAPLPLDLAPSSRYGRLHHTPTRGHDGDGAQDWGKVAFSGRSSGSRRGAPHHVEASPPATVPSTPSPPMWAARRTPPAELVLGPLAEGVEPERTPREHVLSGSSEGAEEQQAQQGPGESP